MIPFMNFAVFVLLTKLLWNPLLLVNSATIPEDEDLFVMPEYLNTDTFYPQVSKQVTIVEFFSPYCSHCKTLAPIWKDVVQTFAEKGMDKEYGIEFKQVDCVQSGDLCVDERIDFYPYIRLYGPDKDGFDKDALVASRYHLKDYPADFQRSKDDIIKFARLEAMKYNSIEGITEKAQEKNEELHTSDKDLFLSNDELVSVISDVDVATGKPMSDNDSPWLIAFTDEYENSSEGKWWETNTFFKNNWKALKKEADISGIKTASFRCKSNAADALNQDVCDEIFSGTNTEFPKLVVVTPKKKINKLFVYDTEEMGGFSTKKIIDFTLRVNHNAYIPEITPLDIGTFINHRKISNEPLMEKRDEKIYVVFQYDSETVTSEDYDFLEHLILPLSKIPNVYFYKTSFDLENFNKRQVDRIVKTVNQEGLAVEYHTNMITNKMLSQVPTFHIYKENSMIPSMHRCFSTVELRDLDIILSWVYRDSLPSMVEIKDTNVEHIFDFDKRDYEQVVLYFLDPSENKNKIAKDIDNYRLNYELYELERWSYQYETLNKKRKYKEDKINQLKNQVSGSDRRVMFNEMKKEILLNDFEKRSIFGVVDLKKYPLKEYNFIHEALKGYSNLENIQPGTMLVIDNVGYSSGKITVFDRELSMEDTTKAQYLKPKNFALTELLMNINLKNTVIPKGAYEIIIPNNYIKLHTLRKSDYSMSTVFIIVVCLIIVIGVLKTKGKLSRSKSGLIPLIRDVITWPLRAIGLIKGPNGKLKFFGKGRKNKANLTYNEVGLLEKSA